MEVGSEMRELREIEPSGRWGVVEGLATVVEVGMGERGGGGDVGYCWDEGGGGGGGGVEVEGVRDFD